VPASSAGDSPALLALRARGTVRGMSVRLPLVLFRRADRLDADRDRGRQRDHRGREPSIGAPWPNRATVRAALGEQPGSPIEMPDEDGDDLPGYEFRVKDPDFLSEMVESAGLSTAAYLEYGEYATFHITIHPDASISGFICRQDGGNDDEVAEMTEDERAESEED
ncbi:MAG TPA: hypothetical protein PKA64_12130, partial [Myxococcota bacterium]|nr:hypothetical protein [Myxococcota bacterium]